GHDDERGQERGLDAVPVGTEVVAIKEGGVVREGESVPAHAHRTDEHGEDGQDDENEDGNAHDDRRDRETRLSPKALPRAAPRTFTSGEILGGESSSCLSAHSSMVPNVSRQRFMISSWFSSAQTAS